MPTTLVREARPPFRRVMLAAGYMLMVQSAFSAVLALVLTSYIEAGFSNVAGGLLGALEEPGAALLVEGVLPFLFTHATHWGTAVLGLFTVYGILTPLVKLAWLAGLAERPSQASLRVAVRTYLSSLRLRLLLAVPAGLAGITLTILAVYTSLLFRAADERTHDLALLAAVGVGAALWSPLFVLGDLGHTALVQMTLSEQAPNARQAVYTGLRALSLGAYARWGVAALVGVVLLGLCAWIAAAQAALVAVVLTQLAAYLRYVSRGVWLASALASTSTDGRFGRSTRNKAP